MQICPSQAEEISVVVAADGSVHWKWFGFWFAIKELLLSPREVALIGEGREEQ